MGTSEPRRHGYRLVCAGLGAALMLAACTGPDEFGGDAPSPSPTATIEPTVTPTPTVEPSPTPEPTPTEEPTPEPTPEPSPTEEPAETPTPEAEPTTEAEPTEEAPEPTEAAQVPGAMESLPGLEELGEGGYIVADQGERTADQLAQAYTDSNTHLQRLDEWGFQQHVYREFTRNEGDSDNELPRYVLATINVYGSPELADLALQWLERLQLNQGATSVDPPDLGDAAVAVTVRTTQGEETASVYIRSGDRTYIYYAQGSEPLPKVLEVAARVFERLQIPANPAD